MKIQNKKVFPQRRWYPMTIPQRTLFSAQLVTIEPKAVKEFNVISWFFSVKGDVDIAALERSYNELVRQHDALRLRMMLSPIGHYQTVMPFEYVSLSHVKLPDRKSLDSAITAYRKKMPVPTRRKKLTDAMIFTYPEGATLFIRCSHYCFDGFSIGIAAKYLKSYYESFVKHEEPELLDPKCSIVHFTAADYQYRHTHRHADDIRFWKAKHHAHPDYRHALTKRKLHGEVGCSRFVISDARYTAAMARSKALMLPLSFFLESIGALALYQLTGNTDFCFSQIAQERAAYFEKQTIGCMMFTFLAFYTIDPEQSVEEFFKTSYLNYLDTFKHGTITPVERLFLSLGSTIKNRDFNFYSIMVSALDLPKIKDEGYTYGILSHGNLPHQIYCTITDDHVNEAKLLIDYQAKRLTPEQLDMFWKKYTAILDHVLESAAAYTVKELYKNTK